MWKSCALPLSIHCPLFYVKGKFEKTLISAPNGLSPLTLLQIDSNNILYVTDFDQHVFVQVFLAALRWINHEVAHRRCFIFELLKHIRLPLLAMSHLEGAIHSCPDVSLKVSTYIFQASEILWVGKPLFCSSSYYKNQKYFMWLRFFIQRFEDNLQEIISDWEKAILPRHLRLLEVISYLLSCVWFPTNSL